MNQAVKIVCLSFLLVLSFSLTSCSIFLPAEIKELEKLEIFSISQKQEAIVLNGVINSSALEKFELLAKKHPQIKQIKIINCEGSINDDVNLELAKYIYQNNFNIHLEDNGLIASGGTDLFLAGRKRTKGQNTKIGVHSWAGLSKIATDFPIGHKHHLPYIDYYKSVGFTQEKAEVFYYFTINAAPAESVHWMTEEEIEKYDMITSGHD